MKIGRPVFRQMAEADPDYISSDCPIAGRHIEQGIGAIARAEGASAHAAAYRVRSVVTCQDSQMSHITPTA